MSIDQYLAFIPNRKMVDWWKSKHPGQCCKGCGIPERNDFIKEVEKLGFTYKTVEREGYSIFIILYEVRGVTEDSHVDVNLMDTQIQESCEKLKAHFSPFLDEFELEKCTKRPKVKNVPLPRFTSKKPVSASSSSGLVLKIKKTRPDAVVPTRVGNAAGYDLHAIEDVTFVNNAKIKTGIAMVIPKGYYGRIASRSSLAAEYGVNINGGVIDEDYRGEIKVLLNRPNALDNCALRKGDRIAQIIIEKCEHPEIVVVDEFAPEDATERGEGGFGSTGK